MEKAHFFYGCLEAELFPPPAGHLPASAGWRQQRVGAGGSPALSPSSSSSVCPSPAAQLVGNSWRGRDAPTVISAVRGGREAERQVGEEAALLLLVADEVHTGGACDVHQD